MKENISTSVLMFLMTGAGWTISMQQVKDIAQIVSLLVPAILSIAVFIGRRKKQREEENEEKDS